MFNFSEDDDAVEADWWLLWRLGNGDDGRGY